MNELRHYTQPVVRDPGGSQSSILQWDFVPSRHDWETGGDMTMTRTIDGTFVPEGKVVSESLTAKLWRWPTRFLNATQAAYFGDFASLAFWVGAAWLLWRALRRR